jgi:hypothetical protein
VGKAASEKEGQNKNRKANGQAYKDKDRLIRLTGDRKLTIINGSGKNLEMI